jgi:hypothetical protein
VLKKEKEKPKQCNARSYGSITLGFKKVYEKNNRCNARSYRSIPLCLKYINKSITNEMQDHMVQTPMCLEN